MCNDNECKCKFCRDINKANITIKPPKKSEASFINYRVVLSSNRNIFFIAEVEYDSNWKIINWKFAEPILNANEYDSLEHEFYILNEAFRLSTLKEYITNKGKVKLKEMKW